MNATFRQAATEHLRCPPEAYEARIFSRCLYRHAKFVAWALPARFFEDDRYLIGRSANACTVAEIVETVNSVRNAAAHDETFKDMLKLRISGRKLIRLAEQVLSKQEPTQKRQATVGIGPGRSAASS